jgi:hypothetical protein
VAGRPTHGASDVTAVIRGAGHHPPVHGPGFALAVQACSMTSLVTIAPPSSAGECLTRPGYSIRATAASYQPSKQSRTVRVISS